MAITPWERRPPLTERASLVQQRSTHLVLCKHPGTGLAITSFFPSLCKSDFEIYESLGRNGCGNLVTLLSFPWNPSIVSGSQLIGRGSAAISRVNSLANALCMLITSIKYPHSNSTVNWIKQLDTVVQSIGNSINYHKQ